MEFRRTSKFVPRSWGVKAFLWTSTIPGFYFIGISNWIFVTLFLLFILGEYEAWLDSLSIVSDDGIRGRNFISDFFIKWSDVTHVKEERHRVLITGKYKTTARIIFHHYPQSKQEIVSFIKTKATEHNPKDLNFRCGDFAYAFIEHGQIKYYK